MRRHAAAAENGIVGAYYVDTPDIMEHFALMTGALVRAFVDARMFTVQEITDMMVDGGPPDATILFIPNFFTPRDFGKYDSKKIAALMDLLYSRAAHGLLTVVAIQAPNAASEAMGDRLMSFLRLSGRDI